MNFGIDISLASFSIWPPFNYFKWDSTNTEKKTAETRHQLSILFLEIWWGTNSRKLTREDIEKSYRYGEDALRNVDLTDYEGGPWSCNVIVHDTDPLHFRLKGPDDIQYAVANRKHAEVILSALNALYKMEAHDNALVK